MLAAHAALTAHTARTEHTALVVLTAPAPVGRENLQRHSKAKK